MSPTSAGLEAGALKRCPFCGGEAKCFHDDHSDYPAHWSFRVICATHDCAEGSHFKTESEAIAAWNRRALIPSRAVEPVAGERDIYEVANQIEGYIGPNTPKPLAEFLWREGRAASDLADKIVAQREHIRKQAEDIMTLGKLVYASETETWQERATALSAKLAEVEREDDETYEIGKLDGYEDAIQDLDLATGGDGEFRGSTTPGETVDVPAMKRRFIERFSATPQKPGNVDWPDGKLFTFHDEPGEHDPCYVVMPDGCMLPVNHHAGEGMDIARAQFIVSACNAALRSEAEATALRRKLEEARNALQPFADLDMPAEEKWATGTFLIDHDDIRRARAITSGGDNG